MDIRITATSHWSGATPIASARGARPCVVVHKSPWEDVQTSSSTAARWAPERAVLSSLGVRESIARGELLFDAFQSLMAISDSRQHGSCVGADRLLQRGGRMDPQVEAAAELSD